MKTIKAGSHIDAVIRKAFYRGKIAFVEFLSRRILRLRRNRQGDNGQIKRAAAAVAGLVGNVAVPE